MFDPFDPQDFFDAIKKYNLIMQLQKVIVDIQKKSEENYDPREKKIGDRVKLWDFIAIKEKNNKEIKETPYIKDNEAIIIEDDLDIQFVYDFLQDGKIPDETKEALIDVEKPIFCLDILLRYPNGLELYTCSDFVKRTDKYEM